MHGADAELDRAALRLAVEVAARGADRCVERDDVLAIGLGVRPVCRERRLGVGAALVGAADSIVLVQHRFADLARPTRECVQHERAQRFGGHPARGGLRGEKHAGSHEHGQLVDRRADDRLFAGLVAFTGAEVVPAGTRAGRPWRGVGGWEPETLRADASLADSGRNNRRHEQIVAEHVLSVHAIRTLPARMRQIHRTQQRERVGMAGPNACVEIGHQARAQLERAAHGVAETSLIRPRPSVERRRAGRVQSERGGERAELHPARRGFFQARAEVPADVVGPEEAADISGRGGEGDLKGEHLPAGVGVAGKMNGGAMIAPAAGGGAPPLGAGFRPALSRRLVAGPTGETHAAQAGVGGAWPARGVLAIQMIQPAEVGEGGDGADELVLLPIDPPEINAGRCEM